MISDKKLAVCDLEEPTPVAYLNLYDVGDVWIKIVGCEACTEERRKRCCGNCHMITPNGWCSWHLEEGTSSKPFYCVVLPSPDSCMKGCAIIYKCIKGEKKGGYRHVTDRKGVIRI